METLRLKSWLAIGTLIGVLSGCAFVRGDYNSPIESGQIEFIRSGITTQEEITARLGAPDEIRFTGAREIDHYRHYRGKIGSFIPVLIVFTRINVQSDDLYVIYSGERVAEKVIYGNRTERMKFRWRPFGE